MHRIKENKSFLSALVETKQPSIKKRILKNASDENIKCLIEILLNIDTILSNAEKKSYKRHIGAFKSILKKKKISIKLIKTILLKIHPLLFAVLGKILFRLIQLAAA